MPCSKLTNANIVTMDPDRPVARDLGIWRGRIVGLDEEMTSLPGLAPGKRAGLVVLGGDPRRVDPSRIGGIEVVATFVDGKEATRAGKL